MPSPAQHDRAVVESASRGSFVGVLVAILCAAGPPAELGAQPVCAAVPDARETSIDRLLEAADCHRAAGEAARAVALLDAALGVAIRDGSGNAPAIVAIHGRLGELRFARGEHSLAIEHFAAGIAAAAEDGLTAEAAPLLNDLGRAYMAVEQPLRGLAAFADSERAAASPALRATAALNLLRARSEATAAADWLAALGAVDDAVARLEDRRARGRILLGLAQLYRDLAPRTAQPERALRLGLRAATGALQLAPAGDDPALTADAHGEVGAAHAALGALDEALAATRRAVLIAQANGLDDSSYRWEWQAGRLLRRLGDDPAAIRSYRAAIATFGRTQGWLVTSRRAFRRDVLPLYEEYADLTLANARSLPDPAAALREVQEAVETLRIAEVRNYFENQCAAPETFDADAGQHAGTVVIYPLLFADRAELLVNAGGRLLQFTADVDLARLTNETRLLRASIEDATTVTAAYLQPAQRLYRWLIAPLEAVLREAAPERLVIVPDGPLRTIPLAVLHDGERFLVERYALATTPGLTLIGAASGAPVTRALVSGITAPVQGFPGLPFVAEELRDIASTVPARVYSDEDFVTATLEREILAGGYSIVHMATHARFESDYRRSFLLAYDDVITLDRLEDVMGSQRGAEEPVDLLVLSACQTAAGDERAALGLAGVAVKAGVRSALASLWFINDESTARLIAEFYRQLAEPANDKADALRGAQLLLMNDDEYRHPAYWAPFLMIGDWR